MDISVLVVLAPVCVGVFVLIAYIAKKLRRECLHDFLLSDDVDILELRVPRIEETSQDMHSSSLSAEGMFASLHGLLKEVATDQEYFSLEIVSIGERGIRFYVV